MPRNYNNIDDFLNEVDKHSIPSEFIVAGWIIYMNGEDEYVSAEDVLDICERGTMEEQGIASIKTIIDMEQVKDKVIELSDRILDSFKV